MCASMHVYLCMRECVQENMWYIGTAFFCYQLMKSVTGQKQSITTINKSPAQVVQWSTSFN